MSYSQPYLRVSLPSHWRQVSFICFDLGVMNVIGGAGVAFFYSQPLHALGFARSSFSLGILFILIGLAAYRTRRLPRVVAIVIIAADVLNTICFLPKWQLAAGVILVKISFLVPLFFTLVSMLRTRLKLQSAKQESQRFTATIGHSKEVFALLTSMFVSVGAGMMALLLFVHYALPAITQANNPLINIFHDLFVVPALLFLFPLGATAGELIWMQASRFYLSGNELALFIRYLKQIPFISRLSEKMLKEDSMRAARTPTEFSVTDQPATLIRRSRLKYLIVAPAILISIASSLILILGLIVPTVSGGPASGPETTPAPGTLVVSQTGHSQFRSINAAIAAAPAGATILVRPGIYRERVIVYKDITLIGDQNNGAGVTIKCYEDGCLLIGTPKATIRNLTIVAKVGFLSLLLNREHPAAVVILEGRSIVEECDVFSNNGPGVVVSGSGSAPEIRNVRVHDCKLNGILFTNKSQGVVENSEISQSQWAGIRSDHGSNPIIRRSRIHSGKMAGILVDQGAATVEECEVFENNYSGVHVREGSSVSLNRSRSFRNGDRGIAIYDQSFAKVQACDVSENKDGGIDVADESDAQILDTKVHHESRGAIAVRLNSTAAVEGATIYENSTGLYVSTGGRPIVRKSVFRSHSYSAIEVENGGDPLIEQSQIYGGQSSGIYFYKGGTGRVQDCAVFGNGNSNIVIASGSNSQISKSRLSESGYAGVLVLEGGQGSVSDTQIFNNYLGMEIRSNSTLSVQDCTIKDNHHHGLVADSTSAGSITGSKVIGNADGAWKIEAGARLVRERNTE